MKISTERGSALLSVLWLSAALAAIAFSLSVTVRGEIERTSTALDGLRCGYLASAGVERAAMEVLWSAGAAEGAPIPKRATFVDYIFPSGNVRVEIIPETAKLDVNKVPNVDLGRLLEALGVEPAQIEEIVAAIDDWRRPGGGRFDGFYASQTPSFRAPHASFEEIEELLAVKGVTPEIFYGTYSPATGWGPAEALAPEPGRPGARLIRHTGLIDCLSVYGSNTSVDANTAEPAVLAAVGVPGYSIQQIATRRREKPLTLGELAEIGAGAAAGRLRVEGNTIVTFRATARLRVGEGQVGDLRRTVAAQVKYMAYGAEIPYYVLRWYDTAWSD